MSVNPGWPEFGKPREYQERPTTTRFGERLRSIRKARGWSQGLLASRAGFNPQMVTHLERGASDPTANTLSKLAVALDMSMDDLWGIERASTRNVVEKAEAALEVVEDYLGRARAALAIAKALDTAALGAATTTPGAEREGQGE